jgi:RHS repeat-associated protein
MWRWDPNTFGSLAPNQNPAGLGSFVYNLRFPGQYYQAETGLYYNYFRDYDPQTGRYVKSDPLGLRGGINSYAYVGGNPITNVDPLGLLGFGFIGGGDIEFGWGKGVAITKSSGAGVFFGCGSSQRFGAFTNSGSLSPSTPPDRTHTVFGASAGLGGGGFLTNASSASELLGPFDTWSFNLPLISIQVGFSNGTWIGSASFGRSLGFDISRYPVATDTATGSGNGCGCK